MANKKQEVADFSEACAFLAISPNEFTALREAGLIIAQPEPGRQLYSQSVLKLAQKLLQLAKVRAWSLPTLAWYADLIFATEVGRSITLSNRDGHPETATPTVNWLGTQYVDTVLADLTSAIEEEDGALVALLRSLLLVAEDQVWPNPAALQTSALYPIIEYFERHGIKIIDQRQAVARDAGSLVLAAMLVFKLIAEPISEELNRVLGHIREQTMPQNETTLTVERSEQTRIRKEGLVAVDKFYVGKHSEIHTPVEIWDFRLGVLSAKRDTITLQMKVSPDTSENMIDNVIDLIRPFLGTFGARVVHLLYEIANDAPYWRSPTITVNTNELLDRLGMKRTADGSHHTLNRRRLRDVLNVAHELEIVAEFSTWENGAVVRKGFYKTVLSLISASFDPTEHEEIPTPELRLKGLPKSSTIRLNFYDGVRRPDGKLGNSYVLMPRLDDPATLPKANHAGAAENLKVYLLFRYRQTRMATRTITLTRATALEKAGIRNKNASRATMTLRKALDTLIQQGVLESYSQTLPTQPGQSFTVILAENVVHLPG